MKVKTKKATADLSPFPTIFNKIFPHRFEPHHVKSKQQNVNV
jgi:hypothetical protein